MRTCPNEACNGQQFEDVDAFIFHMNEHYRQQTADGLQKMLNEWSGAEHSRHAKVEAAWRIVDIMMHNRTGATPKQVIDAYREAIKAVMEEPGL